MTKMVTPHSVKLSVEITHLKNIKNAGVIDSRQQKKQKQKSPVSGKRREFHLLGGFLKICHFENSEVLLLEETMLN